ncbi:MAG: PIN domain-containing protein [Actinopolymorphaceae bacterium]
MFTALLDACVLYPGMQRDFLLSLAIEGMYRLIWSSAILREIEYVEHAKLIRQGIESTTACERAQRLVTMMRTSFDDAEVHGWEPLEGTYGLQDPDDEHLVAAAVHSALSARWHPDPADTAR